MITGWDEQQPVLNYKDTFYIWKKNIVPLYKQPNLNFFYGPYGDGRSTKYVVNIDVSEDLFSNKYEKVTIKGDDVVDAAKKLANYILKEANNYAVQGFTIGIVNKNGEIEEYWYDDEMELVEKNPDVDLSNYYTKDAVYTKEETDKTIEDSIKDVEVDLSDYYTKNDVYNKHEVFTKEETNKAINDNKVDLSNFYTKNDVYTKNETNKAIEDGLNSIDLNVDLSDFYTKEETTSQINNLYGAAIKNIHIITFDENGGDKIPSQITTNGFITLPRDPRRKGFKFVHFLIGEETHLYGEQIRIESDVLAKCIWEQEE